MTTEEDAYEVCCHCAVDDHFLCADEGCACDMDVCTFGRELFVSVIH